MSRMLYTIGRRHGGAKSEIIVEHENPRIHREFLRKVRGSPRNVDWAEIYVAIRPPRVLRFTQIDVARVEPPEPKMEERRPQPAKDQPSVSQAPSRAFSRKTNQPPHQPKARRVNTDDLKAAKAAVNHGSE